MTDYMQKAWEALAPCATWDEELIVLAATLEALDKAEQRERGLREGISQIITETAHVTRDLENMDMALWTVNSYARTLIQPEPDPLVEAIEAMRQTAKELRECPNRDCNLVMQAIMWEKRAADVEARLSIVKGESL